MDRRSDERTSRGGGHRNIELDANVEPQSSPPAVAPNSELPGTILSIQVLRFVAALSVVVYHAHLLLVRKLAVHVHDRVDHAFAIGASGVHIFFVISGFVMVYTSSRSRLTPGGFLKRRLIRIFPIYWLMVAMYLATHQLLGTPYHLTPPQIAAATLLLPGYSPLVIGPGWTLSYEMYFYLCFTLALFAGVRWGVFLLTAFYAVSVFGGFWLDGFTPWTRLATNSLLLEFLAGAWLAIAFLRGWAVSRRLGTMLVIAAICLFASGFWLPYERVPSVISWGIPAFMLVSGSLAFEHVFKSGVGHRLAKLGDSSYLLYLSLVLVLDLLIATPIAALNVNERAAVLLSFPLSAACVLVAAIGYQIIEGPLLKVLKRVFLSGSKRPLAPSVALS
jgi:exopolysaccharide production protein ExoZ